MKFSTISSKITFIKAYDDIPSASGVEWKNENLYIIGDDSPYLFRLDNNYNLIEKIKIYSKKDSENGRIPKATKPDFEALTLINWGKDLDLLIFGSGAKSERENIVKVDFDDNKHKIDTYNAQSFYKELKKAGNLKDDEINIEGAAIWQDELILLNRGNNMLFRIKTNEFIAYLKNKEKTPKIIVHKIDLPEKEGVLAGLSGAFVLPDTDYLVYCASLENTANWIDDGEIMGSYIGIIRVSDKSWGVN